jgi:hypothetical protein
LVSYGFHLSHSYPESIWIYPITEGREHVFSEKYFKFFWQD